MGIQRFEVQPRHRRTGANGLDSTYRPTDMGGRRRLRSRQRGALGRAPSLLRRPPRGSATQRKPAYFRDHAIPTRVPSTPALAHAPLTHQTHRAPTQKYALFHVFDSRATHARTLLPAALASVPFGFVLVRVRVRVRVTRITVASMSAEMLCALPLVTGWRLCFLDVLSVRVLPTPIGLCLFYGTIVRSCAWPSFVFLRRMITLLSKRRGLGQWLAPLYHNSAWRTPNLPLCSLSSLSLLP